MRVPSYRLHKPSGKAIVTIKGRMFYLGQYGTPESYEAYERLIGEYLAKGRKQAPPKAKQGEVTVQHLCAAFLDHAKEIYSSGEFSGNRSMTRRLCRVASNCPAAKFSPALLDKFRALCVKDGNSRRYINQQVGRLTAMFRWGVEQEMVPPDVWQRLRAVSPLKRGRTKAPDRPKVKPVPDDLLDAAIEAMPDDLADMLRLQRLSGMRPGELWILSPGAVDRNGDIWIYNPEHHKTDHKDCNRVIFLGPRSQEILRPYLLRAADELCFRRPSGKQWDRYAYRGHVHKWCRLAGLETFNPYQIQHNAGTDVRAEFGLDGAQTFLGHSHADVTQIYAELDRKKGEEIAKRLG